MVASLPVGRALLALAALLLVATTGCGTGARSDGRSEDTEKVSAEVQACRDQWGDVAQTILQMDSDPVPSSLSQRWSTIIAGVDYQRHRARGNDCQDAIEAEIGTISALRQLSNRLRIYDMEYQLREIQPQAELYLHQPVPKQAPGPDGKPLSPPTHAAVQAALDTLEQQAADANAQLAPAWQQAGAVDLGTTEQVQTAIEGLDRLAQSSPAFQACEQALQVLVAAVRVEQTTG